MLNCLISMVFEKEVFSRLIKRSAKYTTIAKMATIGIIFIFGFIHSNNKVFRISSVSDQLIIGHTITMRSV